jgi:nucleoside-diphosphate-sugar epimerase
MKILITGGTGFLGYRTCCKLREYGYEVSALGRNILIGKELSALGINFIQSDFIETDKIINSCKNQDYVFHCGALSSPWGKYKNFYESNVIGTKNIIAGCKKHNIKRLVHVSTPSIYFEFKDKFNIKETDALPKNMINFYAQTKLLAEYEIDEGYKHGVPVITIRPSGIFGPEDKSIFPRLIKANNEKFIPIMNNKKIYTDITYVDNVVDAMMLCLNSKENTLGKKYNITNGDSISLYDFLENLMMKLDYRFNSKKINPKIAYHVAHIMEFISKTILFYKEPILTRYSVGVLTNSRTFDISAARNDLGYKPNVSIEEGTNKFIDCLRNNYVN